MARKNKTTNKTRTKTKTKTKTKKNKRSRKLLGGAAAAPGVLYSPEKQSEAEAEALTSTSKSNNYKPDNAKTLGVGRTKLVWGTQSDPGWAYMNTTPAQMVGYKKQDMINDYIFAAKLHRDASTFFPAVVPAWNTPSKFIYKKELCEQIHIRTKDGIPGVTKDTLNEICVAAHELMGQHSLFTLDLKPDNLGRLRGKINFIDFSPENSFKLKPNLPVEIKNIYVSLSILILLICCWNHSGVSRDDLKLLARDHINITHAGLFYKFSKGNSKYKDLVYKSDPPTYIIMHPTGYHPSTDEYIDFDFNAPTKEENITQPFEYIEFYGGFNKDEIEYQLTSHLFYEKPKPGEPLIKPPAPSPFSSF